jgi:NitT/TauT family transport system permease protein
MFKYAIIFLGMIFFIIQMVIDVVDDVDMKYIELGLTSGFSNWQIFTKVIVPFSMPRVFDVLRINIGAAWTFLVAAEIIGAEKGLGHLIAISQRFLRMGDLYAGILTFGIIGLLTDRLLNFISKKSYKWYYIELNR